MAKATNKASKADKSLTGIRLDTSKLGKLKHIAWFDRRTFTTVMDMAVDDFLAKWEKANGPITEEQAAEALKKD